MAKKPKKPEAEGEETAEGGAGKKGGLLKNKFVLGGVALLVLLAGGGFATVKMGFLGGHAEGGKPAVEAAREAKKPASFVDLPEMLVNLDSKDRVQYLKVKIALEISEGKLAEEIQPMMPRVLDTFQTYMRDLRPADLEGSAGLFRLKEELTKRVNVAVYPTKIDAILFKEIVVQ